MSPATPARAAEIARQMLARKATATAVEPVAALSDQLTQPQAADLPSTRPPPLDWRDAEIKRLTEKVAELLSHRRYLIHERDEATERVFPLALRCDGEVCGALIGLRPMVRDEAAVLQAAQILGWVITQHEHFCPACVKRLSLRVGEDK